MFNRARFRLPVHHTPAMAVPKGGSSCATCAFYVPHGGQFGQCAEPNYQAYYGTTLIPCPPDRYCSDWYDPRPDVKVGC